MFDYSRRGSMPVCRNKLFCFPAYAAKFIHLQEVSNMANYYRDPTASAAIGAVDKEIHRMEKQAKCFRDIRRHRPLTTEEVNRAYSQFRGIHRRFLKLALGD